MSPLRRLFFLSCVSLVLVEAPGASALPTSPSISVTIDAITLTATPFNGGPPCSIKLPSPLTAVVTFGGPVLTWRGYGSGACGDAWVDEKFTVSYVPATTTAAAGVKVENLMNTWKYVGTQWDWMRSANVKFTFRPQLSQKPLVYISKSTTDLGKAQVNFNLTLR